MSILGLLAFALAASGGVISQCQPTSDLDEDWINYKLKFGKVYTDSLTDNLKQLQFARNLRRLQIVREQDPNSTSRYDLNAFSDWDDNERDGLLGYKGPSHCAVEPMIRSTTRFMQRIVKDRTMDVPDKVDWRFVPGRVTPVKFQSQLQGKCRSSWAFATIGLLEGQLYQYRGSKPVHLLSEQHLIDCVGSDANCDGGSIIDALRYVLTNGTATHESHPYKASLKECKLEHTVIYLKGHFDSLRSGDEDTLKRIVASYGPVAVSLYVSQAFELYSAGVFRGNCIGKDPNHAALIVGYGTDPMAGDYWLIKNSWGSSWGEDGYIRIARGINQCGVARRPIVIIAKWFDKQQYTKVSANPNS